MNNLIPIIVTILGVILIILFIGTVGSLTERRPGSIVVFVIIFFGFCIINQLGQDNNDD